jgi:hypothetical protein
MSVLFALMLAAGPAPAPADTPEKPRLKCEWIHEVGTSRPRRICEKRVEKPKPVEQTTDAAAQPALDHSQHQAGTPQ